MSKDYTKFDWASDRLSRANWDEDEFLGTIDKRVRRTKKLNKKNHRNYA